MTPPTSNSFPRSRPARLTQSPLRWIGCIVSLLNLSIAVTSGQEIGQGAVLLKATDRVLIGRIVQRAEFYEIELATNSRVSIPAQQVAQVANSLEELYQYKNAKLVQSSIGDHYQLTRWCLVNGLLQHAAEHYAVVLQRNPSHPRIRQLGVELEEQLLRDEAFRQYLGLKPLERENNASLPVSTVAHVGDRSNAVRSASTFEASVSSANSIQYPEIAHRFSQRIEPILINRCSQAACHGVQASNTLRLLEPHGKTHSQTTSDNLASALKQVSGNSEQLSKLLQFATQAHGTQRVPAIPVTETKLVEELRDWVAFVHHPIVAAVANGQNAPGLNAVTPGGAPLRPVPVQTNAISAPANGASPTPFPAPGFPVGSPPPTVAELDALDTQLKAALGEPTADAQAEMAVDPFDPSEFNRKAHSQH